MVWVLLLTSAAAVLVVGAVATALLFASVSDETAGIAWTLWPGFLIACALTIASLSLRSVRWIFLLRRAETRIPIRDAYIGYLAGFSLLLTPLLLGETAVRAAIHRRRGGVPLGTTILVNVWERVLDAAALSLLAGLAILVSGERDRWTAVLLTLPLLLSLTPVRTWVLDLLRQGAVFVARQGASYDDTPIERLAQSKAWVTGLAASLLAWLLPAVSFWLIAAAGQSRLPFTDAVRAYSTSATGSALMLAPGGVLIVGRQMLETLLMHGFAESTAVVTVAAIRLATVGVSVALGVIFVALHFRTAPAPSDSHFDDIADAYDVQIPESRRDALLEKKTGLMREVLETRSGGRRGLDVGCGHGTYVARMRALHYDVRGIDMSAGQVRLANRHVGENGIVTVGSALEIHEPDQSFDFVYTINVVHHLPSVEDQRRAFKELLRVLKPGGFIFLHEINTRNVLFRFYMGYVFPSLNCIDEGVERWILPARLAQYTDAPIVDVRYFTFLPDFIPQAIVRVLRPVERLLEASPWRVYSAHYMAVLQKPAAEHDEQRAG
jgi:2-polyprenyl-3-methyl-5-hydroxy-6-metoxy-1,4-benzoquinol methylase/uncharacterized membrane protein YbhN (UPF0104 family)